MFTWSKQLILSKCYMKALPIIQGNPLISCAIYIASKESSKPRPRSSCSYHFLQEGEYFKKQEMTMATAETVQTTAIQQTNPENQKKNRIQVSNTKKPLFFYVNLAKRYLQQHKEIQLSALGMAITTVVTIAEILKNNGFVSEKSILTSTVGTKDATKGRTIQKARIEIVLEKSEKFDSLMNNGKAEKKQ